MQLLIPASTTAGSAVRPAPRPVPGKALTIGLLHNTKPNGDAIVKSVFDALAAQGHKVEAVAAAKHHAGEGVRQELFDKLSRCDLILNALAN